MPKRPIKLNEHILAEASSWFIDINEGDTDTWTRAEFDAWLRRSPDHVLAYLQITSFWENAGVLSRRSADIEALVRRAQAESNVVPLELGLGLSNASVVPPDGKRQQWVMACSIAASVLFVVGAGLGLWQYAQRGTYVTAVGEQRSITLEDRSSIELDSNSRLRVRFSGRERSVELMEGQAFFKVAKDAARPFVVHSGRAIVRAVGTQFDVYRKQSGTVVTVIEGKVAVAQSVRAGASNMAAPPVPLLLGAGDRVTVGSVEQQLDASVSRSAKRSSGLPATPVRKAVDIGAATAWQRGEVVFDDAPLVDAVAEMNRYSQTQLMLEGFGAEDIRISGFFRAGDQENFARALAGRYQFQIRTREHAIILSSPIAK